MLFFNCSYCIELPVALVACKVEGCPLHLYQVCEGGYVALNHIDFGGAERKSCCNCVEEIQGQGKSDILKKVGDSTMYGKDD